MKQLSDFDIEKMATTEFTPDVNVARDVRSGLKCRGAVFAPLGRDDPAPTISRIDLHNHTIEQAWERLVALIDSGARRAVVITGASGILKTEFQKWMSESIISHRIISCVPLNNGSFEIKMNKA